MASKVIAQMLVAGGTMLFRAVTQAYRQAIINGQKSGVAKEAAKGVGIRGQMSIEEAQKILGVTLDAPLEEVLKRYNRLFELNEKDGSFYLQSKVYRARERIDAELEAQGKPTLSSLEADTQQPDQGSAQSQEAQKQ